MCVCDIYTHRLVCVCVLRILPRPPPGDLPHPGIQLASIMSPASDTWETPYICIERENFILANLRIVIRETVFQNTPRTRLLVRN